MAKIIYGVAGEGSGHSSRARVVARHLLKEGHDLRIVSYDRGFNNLRDEFEVEEIVGLKIVSENNEVSKFRTVTENLALLPEGKRSLDKLRSVFKQFRPDCVITDFEPMTAYLANHYDIPLISVDNQHRIRYMDYPCPKEFKKDSMITETIVRAMVPKPTVSLITSFYFGKLNNEYSYLFPPLLRDAVLERKSEEHGHILVYVTKAYDSLLQELAQFKNENFFLYGFEQKQGKEGNFDFRPFSVDGFLDDLAHCKAVIATAGFTLMTEALYFGKPYLALPLMGQFEQILNAVMLEELGYGKKVFELEKDRIAAFLYHLADYREALNDYRREDNHALLNKLSELTQDDCQSLRQLFKQRSA